MNTKFARFWIALLLVLGTLGVSVSPAMADRPVKDNWEGQFDATINDTCSFEFYDHYSLKVTDLNFFDASGALIRVKSHFIEQDTFSANGKTLQGLPYTFNVDVLFDSSGNPIKLVTEGVVMKVPLPDGSWFHAAGKVNFLAHPGAAVVVIPDKGNAINLAGFCAALAP
jgi:hypothetical protein